MRSFGTELVEAASTDMPKYYLDQGTDLHCRLGLEFGRKLSHHEEPLYAVTRKDASHLSTPSDIPPNLLIH